MSERLCGAYCQLGLKHDKSIGIKPDFLSGHF